MTKALNASIEEQDTVDGERCEYKNCEGGSNELL